MDKAELLPTSKIAARWSEFLNEIRSEKDAQKREHQFQHAHGYLSALVDAELLSIAARTELRELLITAAAGRG